MNFRNNILGPSAEAAAAHSRWRYQAYVVNAIFGSKTKISYTQSFNMKILKINPNYHFYEKNHFGRKLRNVA